MILEVKIRAPGGGNTRELRFSKSPIRIGRNQLNDISLDDPFVSEWHGTIRFDQRSVAYFDLGSTNGTLLDGKRLAKNVATDLSGTSRLQLGLLELVASRASEPQASALSPSPSPSEAARKVSGPNLTLAWGRVNVGAGAASAPAAGQDARPAARVGAPRVGSADAAPASAGLVATPHASKKEAAPEQTAQLRQLLEAFTEAFIGLRKGYEQFGAEVGVRTINGSTPLHRARNQRELLDHLLQPNLDVASTTRDLIAIFADFGIHHIAMMQGVTEGIRAILQSLNPQANDIDAGKRLFSGAKTKGQWKAYLDRFDQMITDDNELHAGIFGNEFARAYASVTLGDGNKPSQEQEEEDGD